MRHKILKFFYSYFYLSLNQFFLNESFCLIIACIIKCIAKRNNKLPTINLKEINKYNKLIKIKAQWCSVVKISGWLWIVVFIVFQARLKVNVETLPHFPELVGFKQTGFGQSRPSAGWTACGVFWTVATGPFLRSVL